MIKKKNKLFKIGETVVYPKHGVGEIVKIESMEVAGIKTKFYVVKMEQARLTIRVPLEKKNFVGLRKISSKRIIDDIVCGLKSSMSYINGLNIEDYQSKADFVKITNAGIIESKPHLIA